VFGAIHWILHLHTIETQVQVQMIAGSFIDISLFKEKENSHRKTSNLKGRTTGKQRVLWYLKKTRASFRRTLMAAAMVVGRRNCRNDDVLIFI